MDAGLAAVLGALAGAIATTGAAVATGWASREQARISARAEHKRQRREPREKIYKAFLAEATTLRDLLHFLYSIDEIPARLRRTFLTPEVASQIDEIGERVKEYWLEVTLAGPESVQESAEEIEQFSNSLAGAVSLLSLHLMNQNEEMWRQSLASARCDKEKLDRAIREFTKRAQVVLDDDGSGRPA